MKLFFDYLKEKRSGILLFLIFSVVFFVVFCLYQIPFKAVLYPFILCVFIGMVFFLFDFRSAKKKHKTLCDIQRLTASMIGTLPEIKSIDDNDYQNLIRGLTKEISELEYNSSLKYRDMVDYYTVWAHQIKTPISAMNITLQNEDSPLSRRVSLQLLRIEQYVEMVLAFLRLDSTSTDYVFKEYELDNIIKNCVKRFSTEFIERKIRLDYSPLNKKIITDEKWLSFVIEQLLSNALKYTREGNIKIFMNNQTLCIKDSGIGIATEDLPRIFEKGYTGKNGRLDSKASGLGLYLCKRICENLGIEITAQSEIDKGTTVLLNLEQYKLKAE